MEFKCASWKVMEMVLIIHTKLLARLSCTWKDIFLKNFKKYFFEFRSWKPLKSQGKKFQGQGKS